MTQSLNARRASQCACPGARAPSAFALFHDHARLPWRFHALLNVSNGILIG
ncbi:hypothetical protein [Breoghania sp.]|uniref:hypothetical protein n=1 Tax=Breoghania sp. TaxID=2065378 RepID=UPI0029C9BB3B|nr:hypothetical protein [Breoghania sp.]